MGPLADAACGRRGPWWGAGEFGPHVDVRDGLRSNLPNTEIRHAAGVAINDGDESGIAAAVALCDDIDAVLLCLGEGSTTSGEAASRACPDLPGHQRARSEEHTSELQSLMRISYAVFCLKKTKHKAPPNYIQCN